IATLNALDAPGLWDQITASAAELSKGVGELAQAAGIPLQRHHVGTMFSAFFTHRAVQDWPTAKTSDTVRFGKYFQGMLQRGVYLAPSQFEAGFVSTVHKMDVINNTLNAAEAVFKTL
ncbi:MAG: hypothetical protein PHD58_04960, partial [Anaerolineales bacterium]|nr:hypothetical protein [Anaerolineales bacterium]